MKILFVISSLQIGGEQRVASILTDEFVKRKNEVEILVLNKKEEKQFSYNSKIKISYANCDIKRMKNIARLKSIVRAMKTKKYDIVIAFATIPSILCSMAKILEKTPVIVCERNDPAIYPWYFRAIRFFVYRFSNGAVFQTEDAKQYFDFLPKLKKTVIPNPLNISKLPDIYEGKRRKRIVNTARLVDAKNQEVLINAFGLIHDKFPQYQLVIYGDGPNKSKLERLIQSQNLENKVCIYAAIPNILNEIKEDSVFVLCSNNEGFPNSLAEALALGIPSISTDCRIGGPKDMIDSGVNGTLIKVGDVEGLAGALEELLSNDELWIQYHNEAIHIREKLNTNVIIKKWEEFIYSIINSSGRK